MNETNKTIRVLLLEPGKRARIVTVQSDANSLRQALGGDFEPIHSLSENVCVLGRTGAQAAQMPVNRALRTQDEFCDMSYQQLTAMFYEQESGPSKEHLTGYIVFTQDSFANQKPEAVKLADFDTWKKSNCFIKKGENGILLLEPGEEFRREDGSVGVNYNVKRLFDISQTTSRQQSAPQTNYDMRLLLKSMLRHAPCPIVISENVPENIGAVYDAAEKKILVRQGMDGPEIFRSLGQELAHAHFDKGNYNRADHAFSGYCVAYTLCKRYGVDTANFHFHTMPASFQSMDAKAIRSEVSKIRDCTNQISMDMSRVLNKRPKERTDNGR